MSARLRAAPRLSIRTRLALVYGGVFFAMGLCLIAVSYAIVDHSLSPAGTQGSVTRVVGAGQALAEVGAAPTGLSAAGVAGAGMPPPPLTIPATSVQQLLTDVRLTTLQSLLWTWAALIAALAIAAGLFGWILSARMLKPLRDITGTARQLSVANLHERIGLQGPRDEVRELADTFDGMLGRLDAAFGSQRRFVANASHELRTPLAVMGAQIDVALSDLTVTRDELVSTSRVVRAAVDRCEKLLDGLLALARSDRGLDQAEPVDLADSATHALELSSATASQHGIELHTSLSPAIVLGDHALLDRMVANLVENAVRYNVSDGWVAVKTSNCGSRASVWVENSGPRVPPEQVDVIFEPFRRLDGERTGSDRGAGLGLSIVRSVARAHGGDARARARPEGGLIVEVGLPARSQPAA